jgi:beta-lactamase regulating signal transducer with metallopeptidase domain
MTKQILLTLLNCSWQWGLLGGLTWLITRRFRRANSTTHLLWLLFLLSLPILFVLNQFVPALSISRAVPELTKAQPIEISGLAMQTADLPEIASTESNTQLQGHTVTGSQFSFNNWTTTNIILCIWAIGTLAMLIRVAFGLYRIHRFRCTATVAGESYQSICKRLAQKLNIDRPVTVCFSDRVVSPISFGWLSPHILIPRNLNLEQFELVAAHELAHVQRLDWLTNLFSHVVGAIFFFHPIYHFLNRKLVRLREQICDDWVIQLTGARKKYAQCLLDLVRHENRAIPLALALNQPSQLEARIDSILKHNKRFDLKPKRRLLMLAASLLIICLPLLSTAQLMPLRTVQLSLFAQSSQESEKASEKVEKERGEQKKMMEMKEKKEYKDEKSIKVLDPSKFYKAQENKVYSGPQPGEKLPPLMVTNLYDENEGKTFDITAETAGKPLILFLQDNNVANIKGMGHNIEMLSKVDSFQRKQTNMSDTETYNQGLQIGIVFFLDDANQLPDWADEFLKELGTKNVKVCVSPDGREGPGSYGLNRNVAQTILIAKDGKVLHNFAFTQPAFYADPHVLGAVAQAIEVEPAALEKWLNQEMAKKSKEVVKRYERKIAELNTELVVLKFEKLRADLKNGMVSKEEAAEQLKKLGITWEEGEELLKKSEKTEQEMDRERRYENRRQVRIADPEGFSKTEEKQIFSGPQPGEKLPPLNATGILGTAKGKTFDFIAKAGGQPLVLLLQDESGVGLRGLYDISRIVEKIAGESKQELQIGVVFLSDDPAALKQITRHVPENVLVGISPDGREGPGNYGLNRNVSQTVIIAKEGKVLYNFAFTQPLLFADPHVLGGIVHAIGEKPETVAKWLNKAPTEGERMHRDREGMKREGERNRDRDPSPEERIRRDGDREMSPEGRRMERDRNRDPSPEELVKRFDKDGDGKLNREEGLVARRALANRQNQNRNIRGNVDVKNPTEFKKVQEKVIFSGPQPGEKLPPLKVKGINGEVKGKTIDVIAKADGQPLVLILQDETPLGLRGLVGFNRVLAQIADRSKKQFHIHVVFLGDSPDTLAKQASRIIPHVPSNVLLGISPDGREGPGNYGLNRNVAQTILIVKDGKVLHNFPLTQPMLSPDPYVLGAVGELIGEKPATLVKWLNRRTHTIEIKNPTETEKVGKILLNDREVQIDELPSVLLNLPEEQKALLIIELGENVPREQLVKVLNITKKAGIKEYIFPKVERIDRILNSDQSSQSKD